MIFGTRNGFPNPLPVDSLNGTNGFALTGGGWMGTGTLGVGDLNGDGYADIIVAQQYNNLIQIWVIFGGPTRIDGVPWAASQSILTLANGTNGFNIYNAAANSINTVTTGDINGDKIDDLVFSSTLLTYVVLGHTGAWPATVDPTTISSASVLPIPQGFTIKRHCNLCSVNIGDFNGDGYADLGLIDTGSAPGRADNHGVAAILFGSPSPIGNYDLTTTPLTGTNGFYLYLHAGSPGASGGLGGYTGNWGVTSAMGDVNGDGYSDFLIGDEAAGYNGGATSRGALFVVFGSAAPWPQINDFDTLVAGGARATRIDGPDAAGAAGREFPGSVAVVDLNGDGYGDIVMSAPTRINPNPYGSVYVLFGHGGGWSTRNLYTQQPLGGSDGVRFDCSYSTDLNNCGNGAAMQGLSVTSASAISTDVNGDGVSDLIIPMGQATSATGVTYAGYVYTVFGRKGFVWPAVFPLSSIK